MSWSKVDKKHVKPLKWWSHKILCEFFWLVRIKDSYANYHKHLTEFCKTGFNLYGEKI